MQYMMSLSSREGVAYEERVQTAVEVPEGGPDSHPPHSGIDKLVKSPVFETGVLAGSKPAPGALVVEYRR